MIPSIPDLRAVPKTEAYAELQRIADSVLAGTSDEIAGMATLCALLHHGFGHLWTGFYRVVGPSRLMVGPYQGTPGCLEIGFGRGVCGTAAAHEQAVIVPDVSQFPGHIACDPRARSEIVVPVFDGSRQLIAVLDLDSERLAAFDDDDRLGLERLVGWFERRL
jgi:L-methionine (R)-S-oxide reductase